MIWLWIGLLYVLPLIIAFLTVRFEAIRDNTTPGGFEICAVFIPGWNLIVSVVLTMVGISYLWKYLTKEGRLIRRIFLLPNKKIKE